MFQIRYPSLDVLPPMSVAMPYDVLIGYVGADSGARIGKNAELETRMRSWPLMNDTLRQMGKYLYRMADWDPVRYVQYKREIDLWHYGAHPDSMYHTDEMSRRVDSLPPGPPGRYTLSLESMEAEVVKRYLKLWPNSAQRVAVGALLRSSYILRVRILSIDSTYNYLSNSGAKRYAATAVVMDTIKGQRYLDMCIDQSESYRWPPLETRRKPGSAVESIDCPVIRFEYLPNIYWAGIWEPTPSVRFTRDTAFMKHDGSFRLQIGQEMMVFLSFSNRLLDDDCDYFNLDVNTTCSWGVIRIQNGNVFDLNNVWGAGTTVSYPTFKSAMQSLIGQISNP